MNLFHLLKTSEYGVFLSDSHGEYEKRDCKDLLIERSVNVIGDGAYVLKVKLTNKSNKLIKLNSILVADVVEKKKADRIKSILQNGWMQSSFADKTTKFTKTKKNRVFLKRDQNPYSFRCEFGYLKNSIINEWFTQINTLESSLLVGAITTAKQFTQIYIREQNEELAVRITCQTDGISIEPNEIIESEEILVVQGEEVEIQNYFANTLQKRNNISIKKMHTSGVCCAYYAQLDNVDEQYILSTIENAIKLRELHNINIEYIQIDAGYCPWGDWLDFETRFPHGMKYIADKIIEAGFKPGIWLSPFVASKDSKLFQEHKEMFIIENGKPIESRQTTPLDFIPRLSLMVLDITRDDVKTHLKEIFLKYKEWGFDFFKLDFLYPITFTNKYSKNVTRAEALHKGLRFIREALGKEAILMTAITQLSPVVGLVDFVRTGIDTTNPLVYGVPFISNAINNKMISQDIRNFNARKFLDGKVWIADSDCLVLNKKSGVGKKHIDEHISISNHSGAKWIGDNLSLLKAEDIKLLKNAFDE
jgi:hypothetical protein